MAIRGVNTLCVYLAVFSLLLLSSIGEAGGHRRRARQASRDTAIVASTVATVVGEQSEVGHLCLLTPIDYTLPNIGMHGGGLQ